MENKSIIKAANYIMSNKSSNTLFSDMEVVFVTKKYFHALQSYLDKAINAGWKDETINKVWILKIKEENEHSDILQSVEEVNANASTYHIYQNVDLVVLPTDYYFFLLEAFDIVNEN